WGCPYVKLYTTSTRLGTSVVEQVRARLLHLRRRLPLALHGDRCDRLARSEVDGQRLPVEERARQDVEGRRLHAVLGHVAAHHHGLDALLHEELPDATVAAEGAELLGLRVLPLRHEAVGEAQELRYDLSSQGALHAVWREVASLRRERTVVARVPVARGDDVVGLLCEPHQRLDREVPTGSSQSAVDEVVLRVYEHQCCPLACEVHASNSLLGGCVRCH